jgi:hypothetical protein
MPTSDSTVNISPAAELVSITKSDSTTYSPLIRAIYVGTTGDITVVDSAGTTVLFKAVPQGVIIGPFAVKQVRSTGTSAADMVGFL